MIDVSAKTSTLRTAIARATLRCKPETVLLIRGNRTPKGSATEVAKVAAIQAAKDTSRIIPYCHPLPIDFAGVEYFFGEDSVAIEVTVTAVAKTGVEMEALTAASVAVLTLYDMAKMLDDAMEITGVRLLRKSGGKSDFRRIPAVGIRAAVLVMSDSISSGSGVDGSGILIEERLRAEGIEIVEFKIIPDEKGEIERALLRYTEEMKCDLVLTTGGTGFSPRDNTPEAMSAVIDREAPGIAEAIRNYGQLRTPFAMYSRATAGIRGETLIVNLPGSAAAVEDGLRVMFPSILHALALLRGNAKGHHDERK